MTMYPTPAGHRMAYDRDGSAGFLYFVSGGGAGTVAVMTVVQMQALNDEIPDAVFSPFGGSSTAYFGVIFPELRDVVGYFMQTDPLTSGPYTLLTSVDTTNGFDGTWIDRGAATSTSGGATSPFWRSAIQTVTWSGIKAVRVLVASAFDQPNLWAWHIYGQPSSGQNPDSLRIWQPATDAEVTTVFDFGDPARGSTTTQPFRIKNISATRTATGVALSSEMLTDLTPSIQGHLQFSIDGGLTYQPAVSIGTLTPGAISGVIYVRSVPPAGGPTGLAASRIVATFTGF